MQRTTLVAAALLGFACCIVSLVDARLQQSAPPAPVPPHHIRGWVHSPPRPLWWPAAQ